MRDLRQREPRQVDSDYKAWIAKLPCVACATLGAGLRFVVQVAHCRMADAEAGWRGAGMAEKPHDRRCTPLCHLHHQNGPRETTQHKMNERDFWEELLAINVFVLCAELSIAFDHGQDGLPIIMRHAGRGKVALRERALAAGK